MFMHISTKMQWSIIGLALFSVTTNVRGMMVARSKPGLHRQGTGKFGGVQTSLSTGRPGRRKPSNNGASNPGANKIEVPQEILKDLEKWETVLSNRNDKMLSQQEWNSAKNALIKARPFTPNDQSFKRRVYKAVVLWKTFRIKHAVAPKPAVPKQNEIQQLRDEFSVPKPNQHPKGRWICDKCVHNNSSSANSCRSCYKWPPPRK